MASAQRTLSPGVLVLTGGVLLITVLAMSIGTGSASRPPPQPIDFLHRVHAGDRQIACAFCHRSAETADYAGMPDARLCMSCHRVVIPYSPEVWKLRDYWDLGQPIPWTRVYRLPAHVYFSHEAHTAAGKMSCVPCHGHVESADRLGQVQPLTMGWCVDCHRKRNASTECWSCHR